MVVIVRSIGEKKKNRCYWVFKGLRNFSTEAAKEPVQQMIVVAEYLRKPTHKQRIEFMEKNYVYNVVLGYFKN